MFDVLTREVAVRFNLGDKALPLLGARYDASVIRGTIGMSKTIKEIYFAGGCFWGVEGYFGKIAAH